MPVLIVLAVFIGLAYLGTHLFLPDIVRRWSATSNVLASLTVGMVIASLIIVSAGIQRHRAELQAFMQGCRQDHRAYECTALWRGGAGYAMSFTGPREAAP